GLWRASVAVDYLRTPHQFPETFRNMAMLGQHQAQVFMSVGVCRVDRDSTAEAVDRVAHLALVEQRGAEAIVQLCIARGCGDRAAVLVDRSLPDFGLQGREPLVGEAGLRRVAQDEERGGRVARGQQPLRHREIEQCLVRVCVYRRLEVLEALPGATRL